MISAVDKMSNPGDKVRRIVTGDGVLNRVIRGSHTREHMKEVRTQTMKEERFMNKSLRWVCFMLKLEKAKFLALREQRKGKGNRR